MVVVKERHGYCWCIPINTYKGKGVAKHGLSRQEQAAHATVHMSGIRPIEPEVPSIASPLCQSCLHFLQKYKTHGSKEMAVRSLAYHNETDRSETLEQGPKSLFFHGVHGVPLLLGIRCSRCSRCAGFINCCLRLLRSLTRMRVSGKHNRCILVTLLITLKKQESPPRTKCTENTNNISSALADPG